MREKDSMLEAAALLEADTIKGWSLTFEDFRPERESLRETLCTLGNGYFATRGAAPEAQASDVHYPGTYLAGGYNRLQSEIAGRYLENEDLVNMPNWLVLAFRIEGGDWFLPEQAQLTLYRQTLDLKAGILIRHIRFVDTQAREIEVMQRRFVHLETPHFAGLETVITPRNWSGMLEVKSALDASVINSGIKRYRHLASKHLRPLEVAEIDAETLYIKVETTQSELRIAQAARTQVFVNSEKITPAKQLEQRDDYIAQSLTLNARQNEPVCIEKIVTLFTSRDRAISECGLEARIQVAQADRFAPLLARHARKWNQLWHHFDIEVEVEDPNLNEQVALISRLHIFHLLQTASENTIHLDVGAPARGWHGEAYRGHIFWDELFIFPFFNLRTPEITRALIMYRYYRLHEACRLAREAGLEGALFPWQSGSNGREESQKYHLNPKSGRWVPDNTHLQRHVNHAIAYNVWQYYQVTDDQEFLSEFGAEIILGIARLLASLCTYNEALQRYEILGVMGPDEFHDAYPDSDQPGLNNNTYTNVFTVWVLLRALEMTHCLEPIRWQALKEKFEIQETEISRWADITRKMRVVFHDGVLSQFEGYSQLEEFPWRAYTKKYGDIHRLDRILEAEGDSVNRYKASKQADVLMLFYLFSYDELKELFTQLDYPFTPETIHKTIDYYASRTSHGSTLSGIVSAWVLTRSDRRKSFELFTYALKSDVEDIQGGTTAEGIHAGAMAGTLDLLQRAYTGLVTRGDVLWLNPSLPEAFRCLKLRLRYRVHTFDLVITRTELSISLHESYAKPIRIGFKDAVYEFAGGQTRTFALA